jgi:xylulokinase
MGLKENYLLGVDIGSGSLKSSIVRGDGAVMGSASKDVATHYPRPGWSEQNPEDWYEAFCETVRRALAQSGLPAKQIRALCTTAAAHTPVLLGADDEVLRPAILWTDQRSAQEAAWLNENFGDRILRVGYQRANPTWTLPMLLWVKRQEPQVAQRTKKVMLAKDYLRFRITGTWETDWIDALGTLMLDAERKRWSEELCGYIDWPLDTLPRIVSPRDVVGSVTRQAARDCGLMEGTPVVAGTADTAAEDYGVGAIDPGQGVIKLATAGNTNVMTETPRPHPLLINYYHVVPGMWYTVAATNSCASAHRWLRDQFFRSDIERSEGKGKDAFEVMDAIARDVPVGSEGLLFHPYLLGERSPYWDPLLRADFLGITMRHRREHFVRALYEGIAFSLRDCLTSLAPLDLKMEEARIIGGGSRSALWRQIVCDVMGMEILKTAEDDASFGAALIAGVGVGVFVDERDAVGKCVKIVSSNRPDPRNHERYNQLFGLYKDAQRRLVEINHELHRICEG